MVDHAGLQGDLSAMNSISNCLLNYYKIGS